MVVTGFFALIQHSYMVVIDQVVQSAYDVEQMKNVIQK